MSRTGEFSNPLVSVIVPTYNRVGLVDRALKSVLAQTFTEFELLVVDDASEDGTEGLVRSLSDPRTVYLRHRLNLGCAAARNTAIEASHGDYVAFLDSDDEWMPEYLENVVRVFREDKTKRVGFVGSDFIDVAKESIIPTHESGWVYEDLLASDMNIVASAVVVRRECFDPTLRFDASTKLVEDRDLFVRIARRYEFRRVPMALVRYHVDAPERMNILENRLVIRSRFLEKHMDELLERPRALARSYGALGQIHLEMGRISEARGYFGRAVRVQPGARWTLWFIVTLFGKRSPTLRKVVKSVLRRLRDFFGTLRTTAGRRK